ncbi:MAG: hypothetical protein R3F49_24365 [Planctomycetota bacterium]
MRALLGLLLLGGLFLSAATWQGRMTQRLREQRALEYGIPKDAASRSDGRAGWSELVLGRPSGAAPLPPLARPEAGLEPGPEPTPGADSDAPAGTAPSAAHTGRRYAPDFEYEVQPNDVLGVICQKHYGKGRLRELVPAVARYNDLSSADGIVAGKVLLLPDIELLLGE